MISIGLDDIKSLLFNQLIRIFFKFFRPYLFYTNKDWNVLMRYFFTVDTCMTIFKLSFEIYDVSLNTKSIMIFILQYYEAYIRIIKSTKYINIQYN